MDDSDSGAGDDGRSEKRQKTVNPADNTSNKTADEERAAQMTPSEIVALMKEMKELESKQQKLVTNLAKANKKLKQSSAQTSRKGQKVKKVTASVSTIPIAAKAEKLPDLSRVEKEHVLKKISFPLCDDRSKSEANARGLQIILWYLRCNYCLQNHQFLGARAAAGMIADDFVGNLTLDSYPQQIEETLQRVPLRISGRGAIIADVMGLGKTVEAVAGALLRNAVATINKKPEKPTLICSPNEAVLFQWHQTLVKAGVGTEKVLRFRTKKPAPLTGDIFVLCTIYDLQTELRYVFEGIKKASYKSPLFVSTPAKLLEILRNQYRAEKGKMKNKYNNNGKTNVNEVIRRYLDKYKGGCLLTFRTVILDEAHFLRNLKTYWGMAAALIGLHTERMMPMSGTPFNNTLQDMATLMTFIEPTHSSAKFTWWKVRTNNGQARNVVQSIAEWSQQFLVRRGKDAIAGQLPTKVVTTQRIIPSEEELAVYAVCEKKVLSVQKQLAKLQSETGSPGGRRQMNECFRKFMALAANAMLALDHPMLPGGGRSLSILFSPSRRHLKSALTKQERRKFCVCCNRNLRLILHRTSENEPFMELLEENDDIEDLLEQEEDPSMKASTALGKRQRKKTKKAMPPNTSDDWENGATYNLEGGACRQSNEEEYVPGMNGEEELPDDDILSDGDYDEEFEDESADDVSMNEGSDEEDGDFDDKEKLEMGIGAIVSIPPDLCKTAKLGIQHYACESCLESLKSCPRCEDLLSGLRTINRPDSMERRYCRGVFGGFQASTKLKAILSSFSKIPTGEKAIIVSFYKGSLDLLEAMLTEAFPGLRVARFDGDIATEDREKVLDLFKTDRTCRVLLMTVQTGGVGLNLVEANHMLFVDRFWNPMVLEQCEDRCHRIGQKKKVTVVYHDASNTIDTVMAEINECKASNAGIILADGPALVANPCFKETNGLFGAGLRRVKKIREDTQGNALSATVTPRGQQETSAAIATTGMLNSEDLNNSVLSLPPKETVISQKVESHRQAAPVEQHQEKASHCLPTSRSNASLPVPPVNKAQLRLLLGRLKKPAPDSPCHYDQKAKSVEHVGNHASSCILVDATGAAVKKEESNHRKDGSEAGRKVADCLPRQVSKSDNTGAGEVDIIDLCSSDDEAT